jgi:hypothetical protein
MKSNRKDSHVETSRQTQDEVDTPALLLYMDELRNIKTMATYFVDKRVSSGLTEDTDSLVSHKQIDRRWHPVPSLERQRSFSKQESRIS